MDKRLEQKSEEVDNISNLKRLLLQFHSKAEMENPEFVRMHTKSAKVVDAILDQTLERWFGADIDLTLLAFNFEAEKNKFLGK